MFQFASPYAFFLLIPVGIAAWFVCRRSIRSGILFAPTARLPTRTATWRARAANILPALLIAGLAAAVVALARPQTVLSIIRRAVDVIAIEMVLDCSGSMEALDLSQIGMDGSIVKEKTRLDAVKESFADFVRKRPDDLIGIITFGGYASTRAPLTLDHEALFHILKGIEIPKPNQSRDGQIVNQEELLTAVGDALATACARMQKTESKSKIVVLLSDGESNTGIIKSAEAAQAAKKLGIKVYTIGIGSNRRAPVRMRDMFGRSVIGMAQVTLDEELLLDIAKTTGGRYYNVLNPKGLEEAMDEIDRMEKTRIERDVYRQHTELFPWFLGPALGLIALGAGLNMLWTRRIV
ncbi:MAG: VWA domain-containing protein [Verrucomicrobiota bacterium]|nr:VWA domain-containing protein [Verrucomicrobiota bacterium]